MSVTTDILHGLATRLAAAGLDLTFNIYARYTPAQTGILMKVMPSDPDRVVVLNAVVQGDDPSMPLGQIMVQVRGRGKPGQPTDVDDLLDGIFANLHGLTNLALGSVTIVQMNRRVSIQNGIDDRKRSERIDQYYLDVDYPPTANRPVGGSW